jgi:hypothetical protein
MHRMTQIAALPCARVAAAAAADAIAPALSQLDVARFVHLYRSGAKS